MRPHNYLLIDANSKVKYEITAGRDYRFECEFCNSILLESQIW